MRITSHNERTVYNLGFLLDCKSLIGRCVYDLYELRPHFLECSSGVRVRARPGVRAYTGGFYM